MTTIDTIREQVAIWEAFKDLSDEAVVRSDFAAIFLGISKKTLARLRQNGDGPPYVQVAGEGSDARNQIVNYVMGKLRAYRASKEVSSSMNAAEVRGLTFSTLEDLLEEQPFVMKTTYSNRKVGMGSEITKSKSEILGHIFTVKNEDLISLLQDENMEVVWLSLPDALKEDWANGEVRKPFNNAYSELLQGWIAESIRGQEAADLRSLF